MASVQLQKEKRSLDEIKWKRFSADEMQRILTAMDTVWGKPLKGLSDERRKSICMVCRVLAYSALRPIEVLRLEPEDVCDRWIKVRKSKTISFTRIILLHPKIADFPAFVQAG